MDLLTQALGMNPAEIAASLGVTTRTVRAWVAGVRRPIERNRAALHALVSRVHAEHSAATHRWSAARDQALSAVKIDLMTAQEQAERAAWIIEINQQFAARAVMSPANAMKGSAVTATDSGEMVWLVWTCEDNTFESPQPIDAAYAELAKLQADDSITNAHIVV